MSKSADAFRTISEVADWMDTPAHVLRFWESKFTQVKPVKRAGGRRYYRPADMRLLGGIKKLLHEDGMTIKGAQKILREKGIKHVASLCTLSVGEDDDGDDVMIEDVVATEPLDTVVPFTKTADPAPVAAKDTVDPVPVADAPEEAVDEPPLEENTAQDDLLPPVAETIAEPLETPEPVGEAGPEREANFAEDDAAEDNPDPTPLPGFLQRSLDDRNAAEAVEDAPQEVADESAPEPEHEVEPAVAPPTEPRAGALSALARITRLTPESAREIAPLVEKLRKLVA
ncbi:MerR family transcriptional regulator [Marivita sp. S6314]|uniref:MerR family transcriptional regulator n=1 Tax=Marivita sp. S6314 TaxID=2926406 RepID=UPI001FF34868|nr:MerR family transcriptional regulator [Marivita sp. S6314]MCK0148447.1 MerR family transcriptional regulator [Marivita sp. S6314]